MSKVEKRKMNTGLVASAFIAVLILIFGGIVGVMFKIPYDSGTLAPANLSGNLNYGGDVCATDDYVFVRTADGNLGRILNEDKSFSVIYEGDVSYLNALDGWIYFIDGGKIMRTAFYGTISEQVCAAENVEAMSLNGSWIYYKTSEGALNKIRTDGQKYSNLVSEGVIDYTSDNRIVVYSTDSGLFKISSDGKNLTTLVSGKIGHFCYTLDDLYYEKDGIIHKIPSVVSGMDVGLEYTDTEGKIFFYNTSSENRGQLVYINNSGMLCRKLLQSERSRAEENETLCELPDAVDLYSVNGEIYYHDSMDKLYNIVINGSDTKPVEVKTE